MTDDYILTLLAAHAALGGGEAKTAARLLGALREKAAAAGSAAAAAAAGTQTRGEAGPGETEARGGNPLPRNPAAPGETDVSFRQSAGAAETLEKIFRQDAGAAETLEAIFRRTASAADVAALRRTASAADAGGDAAPPARPAVGQAGARSAAAGFSASAVSDWFRRDARRYGAPGRV